ncbi:hypothetical protein TNCV_4751071 [Trichonephila clavipes]|nr:hypothetical protein TNCV_4751071 [Trichonephila clavipes]
MDVCQCIVPLWHGGTVNNSKAASPLMIWVEREERWQVSDSSQGVPLKIGEEPFQIVLSHACCLKLRLTTGVKIAPYHDELRGSGSDVTVDQVAKVTTTT